MTLRTPAVFGLFFLSGFTGLVLQVLWMRELSLLFGSTAHAAAATLAAFFLGLAAGSAYWGRRSCQVARPLRAYGLLEAGVAVGALAYFFLLDAFHAYYGILYTRLALVQPELLLAIKLLLSVLLLSPAAFFMGGTLPVLSAWLVRHPSALGRRVPLLYGVNTAGAALGTLCAAFLLPRLLGYDLTYAFAVALAALVACAAWWIGGRGPDRTLGAKELGPNDSAHRAVRASAPISASWLHALAFLSGFVTLGLEVLWTRMFAQVLQNSVYSYATILIIFLLALAAGSFLAAWIARLRAPTVAILWLLLVGSALLVALTPQLFYRITDGLTYLGTGEDWGDYLRTLFATAALVLAAPTLILGMLFPYLWKVAESGAESAGETVGRLLALNTVGAIMGSLAAGFLLLEWLGLWRAIQLMAGLYLAAAILLPKLEATDTGGAAWPARSLSFAPVLIFVLLISALDASRLPVVRIDPVRRAESLIEVWEGSSATVAVVRRGEDLRIKVDNYYTLGSTRSRALEQRQAHFPLLMHPDPRAVFFLGMGTGITAGASLAHSVERVQVAELLGDAILASRRYFRHYTQGLFDDSRVRIIEEDGRHHLSATDETYDVIVGDLFIPWKAGNGGLFSLEHFRNVSERLAEGGLFAQWIPLYQVSEWEFGIIARTFTEVFPDVTLWRGDFLPEGPIVALVGRNQAQALNPVRVLHRARTLTAANDESAASLLPDPNTPALLLYYAGNLSQASELLAGYPVNTDTRPYIELDAARTQRAQAAGRRDWFVGEKLVDFFDRLLAAATVETDPHLVKLEARQRQAVHAGLDIFRARLAEKQGDQAAARELLAQATARLTPQDRNRRADEPHRQDDLASLRSELEELRAERDATIRKMEEMLDKIEQQ